VLILRGRGKLRTLAYQGDRRHRAAADNKPDAAGAVNLGKFFRRAFPTGDYTVNGSVLEGDWADPYREWIAFVFAHVGRAAEHVVRFRER
jgi:hypothetical protein